MDGWSTSDVMKWVHFYENLNRRKMKLQTWLPLDLKLRMSTSNLNFFSKQNQKGKKNSNHLKLPANLCLNGSVWVFVLLSLEGPGLETDALLTCPLVVVVDPRLKSVRDLSILWIAVKEYQKRDTEWGKVNLQLIMWRCVLKTIATSQAYRCHHR